MKNILLLIICCFYATVLVGQENPPPPPEPPGYLSKTADYTIKLPECAHIDDRKARKSCVNKNIYEYIYKHLELPQIAKTHNVCGTVVVRLGMTDNGKVATADIVKDIGAQCGKEGLRVVKLMCKELNIEIESGVGSTALKKYRKHIPLYFNLPIKFNLDDCQ